MTVTPTTRLGLNTWTAGTDPFTRAQSNADAAALDNLVAIDKQGLFASRPAAGVRGTYYWATDQNKLYRDDGSAWHLVDPDATAAEVNAAMAGSTAVLTASKTLGTDTHTLPGTSADYQAWGDSAEYLTITNPGRGVSVLAWLNGQMQAMGGASARRLGGVRIEISFNGGSTWTLGTATLGRVTQDTTDYMPISAQQRRAGTPTGNIVIRGMIVQLSGAAGDISFQAGELLAQVMPA